MTFHHVTGFPAFSAQIHQFITVAASSDLSVCQSQSIRSNSHLCKQVHCEAWPRDEPANSPLHLALSYSIRPMCLSLEVKHQSPISSPRLTRLIASTLDIRTAGKWTGSTSLVSGEDPLSPNCHFSAQTLLMLNKCTTSNNNSIIPCDFHKAETSVYVRSSLLVILLTVFCLLIQPCLN